MEEVLRAGVEINPQFIASDEESGLTFSEFVEKMGSGNGGEVEKKESANATSQWGFWWALVAVILSVVGATWIGSQIAGTYGSLVCVGVWVYATWRAGNQ